MTTDYRALCAELTEHLSLLEDPPHELVVRAQSALAQSEPTLTVEDCSNMHKHKFNFLDEEPFGEIVLHGSFTREDLIEIANTVPSTEV